MFTDQAFEVMGEEELSEVVGGSVWTKIRDFATAPVWQTVTGLLPPYQRYYHK